jgi:hypothetical protein
MVFNLKKRAFGYMDDMMGNLMLPPGVNPMDAQFLWANVYKDNPNVSYASIQDMINDLEAEGINREIASWSNPEQVSDVVQPAENLENATQQLETVLQESKPYNLKTAKTKIAIGEPMADPLAAPLAAPVAAPVVAPEVTPEKHLQFKDAPEFMLWLDQMSASPKTMNEAYQAVIGNEGRADHLKEGVERYFHEQDAGDRGVIGAQIFGDDFFPLKEKGIEVMVQEQHYGEVDNAIRKIAQTTAKKYKAKVFNLKKTAQHKSLDNAILYGPGETRIDPFLHQPVSDWHIVERNKGFGLVVDDIWNIDYETIWRENIMDKYSRPYKDKEGNWVGGYLNKRFEIDRNIPEANNMQLKPGQLRKPILPEYGNTESRLQAARAAGDIEGAIDTSKPFNWKEASSKKKS